MAYYQNGNTIHFSVNFQDFDGKAIDPQLTKLIIYDGKYNKVTEAVITKSNRLTTGSYFYNYLTSSNQTGNFYYEWYGEIDGTPSLKRDSFTLGFL